MGADITGWVKPNISMNLVRNMAERYKSTMPLRRGRRKAPSCHAGCRDLGTDELERARNEFICWVEDAKREMTRERRIRRTQEELEEGQRRPCCWPGCSHRERTGR